MWVKTQKFLNSGWRSIHRIETCAQGREEMELMLLCKDQGENDAVLKVETAFSLFF
jgi:hypothetical protein